MEKTTTVSTIVLTKNEEEHIGRCIESLSWSDEIIIVDDFSDDATVEKISNFQFPISNKKGIIKSFRRGVNGDFATQRNFGLEKAKGDWVLFVDADEVISEELASEIKSEIPSDSAQGGRNPKSEIIGYYLKRKDYFLGKWLKYGETADLKFLRLARKNAGTWEGKVHEKWKVRPKLGQLQSPLIHYPHENVSYFLTKINSYTNIVASVWLKEGKNVSFWELVFYPVGKFFSNYILKLGFLDGVPGLILALMMSFHSFLARAKLWQLRKRS